MGSWIGVDLDGTLAHYDYWRGFDHIGEPIPLMADRVKQWLADGIEVRIVTARVSSEVSDKDRLEAKAYYSSMDNQKSRWCCSCDG